MAISKTKRSRKKAEVRLTLDARKRVGLSKLLPSYEVSSFKAYREGDKIILEPMAEIPANELWLYKNSESYKSVLRGLDQVEKGKAKKLNKDFSKYIDEDV